MCLKVFCFGLLLLNLIYCINSQTQSCTRSYDNAPGTCLTLSNCPRLEEEHNEYSITPQLCSYNDDEPIFCCPNQYIQLKSNNRFGNKRISVQKCEEYSKLAVKKHEYFPLLVNPTVYEFNVPQCEYTTPLIVGGEEAKLNEFPHMAAIGYNGDKGIEYLCGGSLISENYILTAAHCLTSDKLPVTIRLGDHNLFSDSDQAEPQNFEIERLIIHPEYLASSRYNDIALIKINKNARFNKFVRPACIWQTDNINSTRAIATGWGRIAYFSESSDKLLKVVLNIISNKQCENFYKPGRKIRNGLLSNQMCAGYIEGGKDTCQGDSGGPLQITTSSNECIFHIIGITSFGKGCGGANAPGVYTRVSSFVDWIESIIWS